VKIIIMENVKIVIIGISVYQLIIMRNILYKIYLGHENIALLPNKEVIIK